MTYSVVSWNVGSESDYAYLCQQDQKPQFSDKEAYDTFISNCAEERKNIASIAVDAIFKESPAKQIPLLCLQEAGDDLEKMQDWFGDNYALHGDTVDTAVAYDKDQYVLVDEKASDIRKANWTILTLRDKKSQEIFVVASAHLTGFDLDGYKDDAKDGDDQAVGFVAQIEAVAKKHQAAASIIGMDANTTTVDYPQRLNIFRNAGFVMDEQSTISTHHSKFANRDMKIDYLFAKVYERGASVELEDQGVEKLGLSNPEKNPSDHRPLLGRVEIHPATWFSYSKSFCCVQ